MFGIETTMAITLLLAMIVALLLARIVLQSRAQEEEKSMRPHYLLKGGADLPAWSRPETIGETPPPHKVSPQADPHPPGMHIENGWGLEPGVRSLTASEKKEPLEQASLHTDSPGQANSLGHGPALQKSRATVETLWSNLKRERTARFVSFINFKGGVGKSTCAVEIAASLAKHYGKRVLLIDLDPQTNATFYLMDHSEWESWQQTNGSLKTLFDAYLAGSGESFDVSRIIKKDLLQHGATSLVPGLELLPSHLALILIDIQLAAKATVGEAVFSSQAIIRQALQQVQDQYDYIIFDCPPNFNLVTQNGLFASDCYVIPAIPDYLSTLGISMIQGEVSRFSNRIRTALAMFGGTFTGPELKGIIFTRVRTRSRKPLRFIDLHERRMQEVSRLNPDLAFKHFISEGVRFAEAPERQMPVSISPRIEDREARDEFVYLAEEFIARIEEKENYRDMDEHAWLRPDAGDSLQAAARVS